MKKLYKFYWDCRDGRVEGLFIAEEEVLAAAIGTELHFGEILGKYSEIYGTLTIDAIEIISEDQDFIAKLEEVFKDTDIIGYNPLNYPRDEEAFN